MRIPRTASRLLPSVAAVALAGCAGGSGQAMDAAGSGRADDRGADVTCSHGVDLTAAAPACNSLVNAAHAVPFTARAGSPPAPMGGPIVDGVYVSTATEGWGAVAPAGRRVTIVVAGGGTQMLWKGDVLDANGVAVTLSFAATTRTVAVGDEVTFTVDCSSTSPSPIPP